VTKSRRDRRSARRSPSSRAVHASVSGSFVHRAHAPPGRASQVKSIVIESEGEPSGGEWHETARWEDLDKDEIKSRIKEAGIVGLGGAAFPTHVKLSPPPEKTIDAFILNASSASPISRTTTA